MYYRCVLSKWHKFFLWDIYILRVSVAITVCRECYIVILSCLGSIVYFRCIVRDSLYHNLETWIQVPSDIVHWHLHPATVYRIVFLAGRCSVILCHYDDVCDYYWDFFWYSFWPTYLGFLKLVNVGSATTYLPGCVCTWTFSLNIGLNMSLSGSFISCFDSLLGYLQERSRLCNWLPLRCHGLSTCFLHFCPFFENLLLNDTLSVWQNEEQHFRSFNCVCRHEYMYLYIAMAHNMKISYFHLLYFHVSNITVFFAKYSGTLLLHIRNLDALY